MALTTCRECNRKVSKSAKVCPGCGVKRLGFKRWQALIGLVFLFLIAIFFTTCSGGAASADEFTVQGGTARDYKILESVSYGVGKRGGSRIHIVSEMASSQADRAATAQAAAKAYLKEHLLQQVTVHLEVNEFTIYKGAQLAIATYTPDGCGNSGKDCDGKAWEISASEQQLTPLDVAIMKEWHANKDSFKQHGLVNEDKLELFISKKLRVPLEQVTLPYITREEITK
ncbi:DUF4875 domain-containing protein [Buttiauxella sp. 3AFRM03]|uniref:DUF4875 domain-containing protein n=1 Tax=Buttiauxella sp. 3AFRM03 TaxID=2479367 RepID=UPI000EF7FC3A|nr:DUF4875 domain-containing protein [Buttiauxella sp. 3AFRM03]AYN28990.1 DUF4875 domain-containing protein [Buttiauxella sp. 3AFRM03]